MASFDSVLQEEAESLRKPLIIRQRAGVIKSHAKKDDLLNIGRLMTDSIHMLPSVKKAATSLAAQVLNPTFYYFLFHPQSFSEQRKAKIYTRIRSILRNCWYSHLL